jgi:hypothetical protein
MKFGALLAALFWIVVAEFIAGPVNAQVPVGTGRWQVDWGDLRCLLIRHPAGDDPMLVVRTIPGTRIWELTFVRREWPAELQDDLSAVTVRLQPDGIILEDISHGERNELGEVLTIGNLATDFVEQFAASRSVRVESGDAAVYDIAIDSARRAVAALRECETDALRQWGVDPVAFAAASEPPAGEAARFFRDTDYPSEALRAGISGMSLVRIDVDANGRVGVCTPVLGGANAILNVATCEVLLRRARLTPARDRNGAAISSQRIVPIRWVIPQ